MSAIGVIATLTVAEGKNAEFEAIFAELSAAVNANEPGNEFYSLTRQRPIRKSTKCLNAMLTKQRWTNTVKTDYFRAAGPKLAPCLAAAPDIEVLDAF